MYGVRLAELGGHWWRQRTGRGRLCSIEQVSVLDERLYFKPSRSQCGADLALVVLVETHVCVASLVLDGEPVLLP